MFQWRFDESTQTLHAPAGLTISVREIAHWVQDRVYNRHDLTGPWAGFRVRGRYLIGPHGVRLTPDTLRQILRSDERSPGEA